MTSTDVQLALRLPLWARAFVVFSPLLFAWFLVVVLRPDEGPVWWGALGAFALSPLVAWRLFRLAAIGTTDGRLVVRNHWRDRTVHRDDVDRVVIDIVRGGWSVQLELIDGSVVPLEVTGTPLRPLFGARLERQADALREWVDGRPRPFL